eukprot:CAMPEP_0185484196 /NCGR_PEP_ID=MMETSP1366-20130426/9123_1 /TAXON_ID=38817 /ORGANISM="Gephyrocapsa oceanica, Strain RCC1303" /LENGTH=82 /DNA_ID=CAMNT_0028092211 /DNA_START=240 /DNA_END=484 /DNA_ORIENTATION=+
MALDWLTRAAASLLFRVTLGVSADDYWPALPGLAAPGVGEPWSHMHMYMSCRWARKEVNSLAALRRGGRDARSACRSLQTPG